MAKQYRNPKYKAQEVDVKGEKIEEVGRLPEWVKCHKCGKPPFQLNWLKPINPDPSCKVLIHLGCIESGPLVRARTS